MIRETGNSLLLWSVLSTAAQGEGRRVESREVLVMVQSWHHAGVEGCCQEGEASAGLSSGKQPGNTNVK